MSNRRFMLIIMDPSAALPKRISVARSWVELGVAGLALCILAGIAMIAHAIVSVGDARQAREIREENQDLRELASTLEGQLPELRRVALSAEVAFGQIWAKSGLGVQPRSVGVGPFEPQEAGTEDLATASNTSVMNLEPIALPLELERLAHDGRAAQQSLGELLEYFHDAERMLSNTPSVRPAHTPWITSSFGMRRDPVNGTWMMHKGLDFGGQIGHQIFAPADGVVIFVGFRGGYGQTVVIDHGYGLQTHFAHLSKYRCTVGDRVRRGDAIAEMGSTGKSTGPHLHYEVRRYGRPLDPARFVLD
jgi:murein DD-endopeptidase MepM/ murein hydrolase activator NlpD